MSTISMTYGFGSLYKYSAIIYISSRIMEMAIKRAKVNTYSLTNFRVKV
jgi:hypothetical protein